MDRDLTSAQLAALLAQVKRPHLLFAGEFNTGWLRLWTGAEARDFEGETYLAGGRLVQITKLREISGAKASGVEVGLRGLSPTHLALVQEEVKRRAPCVLQLMLLDPDDADIDAPIVAFRGRLDQPEITDEVETQSIVIRYDNRLRDLERARELRLTAETQALFFKDDKGLDFVPAVQDWNGKWGVT